MKTVRIVWPNVHSSQGKHLQDETPTLSFKDADALIDCGAAVEWQDEAQLQAEADAKAKAEAEAAAAAEKQQAPTGGKSSGKK